jgi:MYXO-CTERM domain-containing protein
MGVLLAVLALCGCGNPSVGEHVAQTQQPLTTVDTRTGANGSISSFGAMESYGQTITAPATDTRLTTFGFVMSLPASVVFRGEVYAWSGTQATGPNLYESAPRSTTGAANETVTFDTGGLLLTAGQQYVLFATRAKDTSSGSGSWALRNDNLYPGGNLVFTSGPSFGTQVWNSSLTSFDLGFTATFTAPAASATALATSKTPSVFGESVTFTATVTGGASTPAGTVTFKDGAATLGTGTLNGAGQASFATAGLSVGTHSITAEYGGSGALALAASTSAALSQVVGKAATTTALSSSVNPTVVGGSTTLTATVSVTAPGAGTPTGTATFKEGATVLGSGAIDAGGVATLSTSALAVGSHAIVVEYGGDASFAASTSPGVTQVVNPDGASVALGASVNPSTFGSSTTFTATVTSVGTGGTPTGDVAFKSDGTLLGTVAVDGAGVATYATAALAGGVHTITAEYAGDTKHAAASGSLQQTVGVGPSATALVSLTNPSVFGQSFTLRATVTGTGATATGTVTFSEGATTLGTGTVNGAGQATLALSTLSVGMHSIIATYGGDSNFGASASTAVAQTVDKAATTTALISSSQPSIVGGSVTFTATVSAVAPGAGTPSGTVTFKDGATTLGTGTLDAGGVATLATSSLAVGSHTITADYGGSASFATSSSAGLGQTVDKDGVVAQLASSLNPSTFGASVTFTATITSSAGGGTPTGTVTFKEGATTLGTGTLDAGGVATYSTSTLPGGTHMITASYGGDGNHAAGSSASIAQVVGGAATTTTLTSSVNPSVFGQSTTLTATVTSAIAGTQTGTVTFSDGVTTLGTAMLNAAGVATFSTSTFSVGTHALGAVYGGDTNFATSTSAGLAQVVNKGGTATAVTSSSNPSLIASSVTFTATVTATAPSTGTPSGTVTFKDGATTLGTGTLDGAGVATYATTALTVGAHSITAVYGGSGSYEASTSAALTQNVNAAAATIVLKSAPAPSTYGVDIALTATLTGAKGTPTGTVAFKEGMTVLGMGTLSAGGVATFTVSTKLPAGTHSLTAAYSGDTTYATGTGTVSHVVAKAATTTMLVSALNPSTVGTGVTFTATVASTAAGFTGEVELFEGAVSLGVATLTGDTATISTSVLVQGSRSITATYKGDANFAPSTSTALTQTVDAKPAGADAGSSSGGIDAGAPVEPVTPPSSDDSGCGCRIEGPVSSSGGVGAIFALAGVAVVVARRRRRR